jgi:hypothetical protein
MLIGGPIYFVRVEPQAWVPSSGVCEGWLAVSGPPDSQGPLCAVGGVSFDARALTKYLADRGIPAPFINPPTSAG